MKYFYGCDLCKKEYESSEKIGEIEQHIGKPITCYSCGSSLKQIGGAAEKNISKDVEDRNRIVNGLVETDSIRTINSLQNMTEEEWTRRVKRVKKLGF